MDAVTLSCMPPTTVAEWLLAIVHKVQGPVLGMLSVTGTSERQNLQRGKYGLQLDCFNKNVGS